jgi:ferredoxin
MPKSDIPIHYVCTLDEAKMLCDAYTQFWVSDCGCREGNKEGCARSRIDVCLMFSAGQGASGSGKREITKKDVAAILVEARDKNLVARPFRSDDRTAIDGICFCCDDCCGYFLDPKEICDKGALIEKTDKKICTQCGACVPACYFKARSMNGEKLAIDRERCYGCGLCAGSCPADCIEIIKRK